MRRGRRVVLTLAAIGLAAGACVEQRAPMEPTAVESAAAKRKVSSPAPGVEIWAPVKRDWENKQDIYAAGVIGPKGGTLTAGDISLKIPSGALLVETPIFMLTLQDDDMYVLLSPHGLKFERPATLTFDVSQTNAKDTPVEDLKGVYFQNLFSTIPTPLENYKVSKNGGLVTFEINHFSYYSTYRRGYTAAGAKTRLDPALSRGVTAR